MRQSFWGVDLLDFDLGISGSILGLHKVVASLSTVLGAKLPLKAEPNGV